MDAPAGRAYEDFVPPHNMVTEPATRTFSVDLTAAGYRKEHIRVQLVSSQALVVVRGERPVAGNRWSRFKLEFRVPDGCDSKGIQARFEGGVVRVTMAGLKTGPSAMVVGVASAGNGKEEPPAAANTDANGGQKEEESARKKLLEEEEHAREGVKDGGRLDQGAGAAVVAAAAPITGRGYSYLLPERRKLVTSVVSTVLVLFCLGVYVRYSFGP